MHAHIVNKGMHAFLARRLITIACLRADVESIVRSAPSHLASPPPPDNNGSS